MLKEVGRVGGKDAETGSGEAAGPSVSDAYWRRCWLHTMGGSLTFLDSKPV